MAVEAQSVNVRANSVIDACPVDAPNGLVLAAEGPYVRETATGLSFWPDTPIEVWGRLVERLIRAEKRIQWAIGDALRFGEQAYGDTYAQWVEETGLSENTLTTYRWVADRIEPARRRKDVGWSHHREVAALPAPEQDRILDLAEEKGLTRFAVRQLRKGAETAIGGASVDAAGAPIEEAPALAWKPGREELTAEARAALDVRLAGMGKAYRIGGERLWIDCLVWLEARECFVEWKNGD